VDSGREAPLIELADLGWLVSAELVRVLEVSGTIHIRYRVVN